MSKWEEEKFYDKINKILYSVTLLEFRSKVTNILLSHVNGDGAARFAHTPAYHTQIYIYIEMVLVSDRV